MSQLTRKVKHKSDLSAKLAVQAFQKYGRDWKCQQILQSKLRTKLVGPNQQFFRVRNTSDIKSTTLTLKG